MFFPEIFWSGILSTSNFRSVKFCKLFLFLPFLPWGFEIKLNYAYKLRALLSPGCFACLLVVASWADGISGVLQPFRRNDNSLDINFHVLVKLDNWEANSSGHRHVEDVFWTSEKGHDILRPNQTSWWRLVEDAPFTTSLTRRVYTVLKTSDWRPCLQDVFKMSSRCLLCLQDV